MAGVVEESLATALQLLAKLADQTLHRALVSIDCACYREAQRLQGRGHVARIVGWILQSRRICIRAVADHQSNSAGASWLGSIRLHKLAVRLLLRARARGSQKQPNPAEYKYRREKSTFEVPSRVLRFHSTISQLQLRSFR